MKCPKCGYNSFDYLASCKKCGNDLKAFKSKFNLRSLIFPGREMVAPVMAEGLAAAPLAPAKEAAAEVAEATDFGFDFNAEDSPPDAPPAPEKPVAEAAAQEDGFDIDWDEPEETSFDLAADEPADTSAAEEVASGQDFDFETDSDLDDLLQDEGAPEPRETVEAAGSVAESGSADLDWEDDALPDLSMGEEELPPLGGLEEESALAEPEGGGGAEEDDAFAAEELPGLAELDFEEIGEDTDDDVPAEEEKAWGEIDFGDDEADKAAEKKPKGKGEGPSDPFDQPESALGEQAPEFRATDAPGVIDPVSSSGTDRGDASEPAAGEETLPLFARVAEPAPAMPESAPAERELPPAGEDGAVAAAPCLPASLLARFGAFCLDLFLLAGVFLLFLICGTRLLAPPGETALLPSLQVLLDLSLPYYVLLFTVSFLYFTLFHFVLGQTPGKMLFALRVETAGGEALSLSEAFLRTVGGLASLLAFGAGFLFACFDGQGRGWNDRFAGTRVVAEAAEG